MALFQKISLRERFEILNPETHALGMVPRGVQRIEARKALVEYLGVDSSQVMAFEMKPTM